MKEKENGIFDRLDNIEKILKMLLVNNVLGRDEISKIQENVLKDVEGFLLSLNMKNPKLYYIEDKYYIFVKVEENSSIKTIKNNYNKAREFISEMKIVLVFDKIYAKRKKALEDSKISFYIDNGEMRIF